jgi:hypothetical protein
MLSILFPGLSVSSGGWSRTVALGLMNQMQGHLIEGIGSVRLTSLFALADFRIEYIIYLSLHILV